MPPKFISDSQASQFFGQQAQTPLANSGTPQGIQSQPVNPSSQAPAFIPDAQASQFFAGAQAPAPQPQTPSLGGFASNVVSSGMNAVGNIAGAIAHPIDTVENIGKTVAGGVEKLIPGQQGQEANFDNLLNFFKERYGGSSVNEVAHHIATTAYHDPVGFAMDLSAILGGGAGIAGKIGDITDAARGLDIANAGGKLSEISAAQGASTASQVGSALGSAAHAIDPFALAGKAAGAIASPVTNALHDLPNKLYDNVLGTTAKMIEKGKSPAGFLADEGLVGTAKQLFQKVSTNRDLLEEQINSKLATTPGAVQTSSIIAQAVDDLMHQAPGAYTRSQIEEAIMKAPVAGIWDSQTLSFTDANQLRKTLDNKILGSNFFMSDTTQAINKLATEAITNALRQTIKSGTGTFEEFSALSKYIAAQKLLAKQLARAEKYGANVGLKDLMAGSIGATLGGIPGAIATETLKKVSESPLTKTIVAQGIKKTAKVAGKVAESKVVKVGTNPALRQGAFQAGRVSQTK